jgi:thioredoxin 1
MVRLLSRFAAACAVLLFAHAALKAPALNIRAHALDAPRAYDELANAAADIAAAFEKAASERKLVLLVFGANWCPDCRTFEAEANAADLGTTLALNYVIVKIDVARFNKNTDIARKYGLNVRRGIPAAVILKADGTGVDVADGRQIEGLRQDGQKAVVRFFEGAVVSAQKPAS